MKCPKIHVCIRANINTFILQVIYILGFCLQYNIKKLVWRIQIKTRANKTKSILHGKRKFSETGFLS